MNDLGILFVWCAIQVSVVVCAAAIFIFALRRCGFSIGSVGPTLALVLIAMLPGTLFIPMPSWFDATLADPVGVRDEASRNESSATTINPTMEPSTTPDHADESAVSMAMWGQMFLDELSHAQPTEVAQAQPWKWTGIFACAILVCTFLGTVHLLAGIFWIKAYRRRSLLVEDEDLNGLLNELREAMKCSRSIELRETSEMTTAATIGWRRPIILVPCDWRNWTEQQRRAVLAHELAHICRHDYLACVLGQMSVAIHFYHPLVHWLASRLRLEQEIAADDLAATCSGGRKVYLATLAEMALEQAEQRVAWAASAFVPTRSTFMRRISMLRQDRASNSSSHRWAPFALAMFVLIAGIAVVGLRAPTPLLAAQPKEQPVKEKVGAAPASPNRADDSKNSKGLSLANVPPDAVTLVALRPSTLAARPGVKPLVDALDKAADFTNRFGISIQHVEQFTLFYLKRADGQPELGGYLVKTSTAKNSKALLKKITSKGTRHEYNDQPFVAADNMYCFMHGRTVAVCKEEHVLRKMIDAGSKGASQAPWHKTWRQVETSDFAAQCNFLQIRDAINGELGVDARPPGTAAAVFNSQMAMFSPLWNKADSAAIGIGFDGQFNVKAFADCDSDEDAKEVEATLTAAATLARNTLPLARKALEKRPGPQNAALLRAINLGDQVLDDLKTEIREGNLTVQSKADADESILLVSMLLPAVQAAQEAAYRAQSMNNLKQIAIAFHNYHDVNRELPKSKNGDPKHPHSWRVALLPYLEQKALYDQYRFDEPWDSENNKKLIDKIPNIYRHPKERADSTSASYFVLTGDETIFDSNNKFAKMRDGTSNTVLAVEAKREIPWTKPEDLPYETKKPLPKFGGYLKKGFNISLADGSVRFIFDGIDEKIMRGLITAAGGETVRLD